MKIVVVVGVVMLTGRGKHRVRWSARFGVAGEVAVGGRRRSCVMNGHLVKVLAMVYLQRKRSNSRLYCSIS